PNAIGGRYQDRLMHPGKGAVEHATEAADLRKRPRIESGARKFLDLFGRAIGSVDIYPGRRVGCRFCHRRKSLVIARAAEMIVQRIAIALVSDSILYRRDTEYLIKVAEKTTGSTTAKCLLFPKTPSLKFAD